MFDDPNKKTNRTGELGLLNERRALRFCFLKRISKSQQVRAMRTPLAGSLCLLYCVLLWTIQVSTKTLGKPAKSGLDLAQDPLLFLRSKPSSSGLGIRPYTLSLAQEDYHYAPKPKHMKPVRLLRVLGASFDPFWMSVEKPSQVDAAENGTAGHITTNPELAESAARYQRKLESEVQHLRMDWLSAADSERFRAWLVHMATCRLTSRWVDLGPVFWPRWIRHTDCEDDGSGHSCSFPAGMACKRAQVTQIKILAWHCWFGSDGVAAEQQCTWRQVPYPVVTACKCSCK
ncbi:noggin-2-like [Erpetoichthys calabaricus]|uniref:Noggin-2-like n=1 Tax=Erpetoichthys calabaricus TaxID=27687 RepID=A0A8C4SEU5_ERPCA|nr:noggin-2-like [Erpetoichthys calabaricus]